MTNPVAHFDQVTKVYGAGLWQRRITAVEKVTLSVPPGIVLGLVGPNRAGKTTLVKLLLSLCRPTAGRIQRFGRPASDRRTLDRVGYLHESQAFPGYLTACGLLDYYGALALVPRGDRRRRAVRLLDRVGLADRAGDRIGSFSKGMLQRLALAQALINEPELLVLDEPSEGMDLLARRLLHDLLREHRRAGKTAVLVSHNPADVERLCDEVAVLRAGQTVFHGPLAGLAGETDGTRTERFEEALAPLYAGAES